MLIPLVVGHLEAICSPNYAISFLRDEDWEDVKKDLELYKEEYYDAYCNLYDELKEGVDLPDYDALCDLTAEEFITSSPLYKYILRVHI